MDGHLHSPQTLGVGLLSVGPPLLVPAPTSHALTGFWGPLEMDHHMTGAQGLQSRVLWGEGRTSL